MKYRDPIASAFFSDYKMCTFTVQRICRIALRRYHSTTINDITFHGLWKAIALNAVMVLILNIQIEWSKQLTFSSGFSTTAHDKAAIAACLCCSLCALRAYISTSDNSGNGSSASASVSFAPAESSSSVQNKCDEHGIKP